MAASLVKQKSKTNKKRKHTKVNNNSALAKECAHIANPDLWATKSLLAIAHLAMHFSMLFVIDKTFITFVFIKMN